MEDVTRYESHDAEGDKVVHGLTSRDATLYPRPALQPRELLVLRAVGGAVNCVGGIEGEHRNPPYAGIPGGRGIPGGVRCDAQAKGKEAMSKELPDYAIDKRGRDLHVDLWYPGTEGASAIDAVHVGLMHVRAADDIRITYDFDRDGYSIKQASVFEWENDDDVCDPDWQEVAFVKAWGRDPRRG